MSYNKSIPLYSTILCTNTTLGLGVTLELFVIYTLAILPLSRLLMVAMDMTQLYDDLISYDFPSMLAML